MFNLTCLHVKTKDTVVGVYPVLMRAKPSLMFS